jgi:hypothetical protein
MAADPLHAVMDDEDLCAICHEPHSAAQAYTLPECQHTFHTHCIVTWFRHKDISGDAVGVTTGGDGPCPYCMNRGVNQGGSAGDAGLRRRLRLSYYRRWSCNAPGLGMREKLLRRFVREAGEEREGVASIVKKALEDLSVCRKAQTAAKADYRAVRNGLLEQPLLYAEARRRMVQARRKACSLAHRVNRAAQRVLAIPIVPLIIPIPLDLN